MSAGKFLQLISLIANSNILAPYWFVQFSYFSGAGVMAAYSTKTVVVELLSTLSASADVLAMAKLEVDLRAIPEGRSVVVKWRGKPVFIRHR